MLAQSPTLEVLFLHYTARDSFNLVRREGKDLFDFFIAYTIFPNHFSEFCDLLGVEVFKELLEFFIHPFKLAWLKTLW